MLGIFVTTVVIFPCAAAAQVVISEFLYDAEGSDTDREYVELFNAGASPVDLTKWKINDGSNHTLNAPPKNGGGGSRTLAPGAYALLVDSAADFIPLHSGVSVAIIDTVLSLPNVSGAITLIDDEGATADSVSYDKEQGGAGDGNALTRTGISGLTFVAASPTPGRGSFAALPRSSTDTGSDSDSAGGAGESAKSTSAGKSTTIIAPPAPRVSVDAGGDRIVTVGVDVAFKARAYDQRKELLPYLRFHWNFGDGSIVDGPTPVHRFDYPGRYVVIVHLPEEKDAAPDELLVTVEPLKLALSSLQDGGVGIENRAGRTLDLSLWTLQSSGRQFVIPAGTFLLANSTLRLAQRTLGFQGSSETELTYPDGTLALRMPALENENVSSSTAAVPQQERADEFPAAVVGVVAEQENVANVEGHEGELEATAPTQTNPSTQSAAAGSVFSNLSPIWWLGALCIAGLGVGSLVLARKFGKREWDIVEETGETG